MKLTRKQLNRLIENYLSEQDSVMSNIDDEDVTQDPEAETDASPEAPEGSEEDDASETPDISFEVKLDDRNRNIELKSLKSDEASRKSIFVDGELKDNINAEMDLQIIAAHGYVHPKTDEKTKEVLSMILRRDRDFQGKNDSGIKAVIDNKMQNKLGTQSLGLENLRDILDKG